MAEGAPKHLVVIVRAREVRAAGEAPVAEPAVEAPPAAHTTSAEVAAAAAAPSALSSAAAAAMAIDMMVDAPPEPPAQPKRRRRRPLPDLGEITVHLPTVLEGPYGSGALGLCAAALVALVAALLIGTQHPRVPGAPAAARVEEGDAYTWLLRLQARFPGRWRGSEAHARAPTFIAESLRSAGADEVALETHASGLVNVIARVHGKDRDREVVLAAHHDVVAGAPGAIDDGGAIAVLIAATRALTRGEERPECDIVLAVFDGEESGCLGARAHLLRLAEEGRARVQAMIAIELVGWEEDQLVVHTIPYGFAWDAEGIAPAWLPQSIRVAAAEAGLEVGLGDPWISPWYQGAVRVQKVRTGSDAGAYLEQGIPACMLSGSALSNFYEGYHRASDDMGRVDLDRLDDAARVATAAAVELAAMSPGSATREQGSAYFAVGTRTVSRLGLTLIGLLAAAAALVAGIGWIGMGRRVAAALLCAAAGALTLLTLLGDITGLVIGVPLCLGLAAASTQERRRLVLCLSWVPMLVQAVLMVLAGMMFGFEWRGGALVAFLLPLLGVAGFAGSLRLSTLRPE